MGIGFVLLLWAVAGVTAATVAATFLGTTAALLTRKAERGRRRAIAFAVLLPFACLVWAGGVFIFQAVVNETLLHRDLGMGDTWHAPLPNGYQILMIDITDQGTVYNPKTQLSDSGVSDQEDAISGVRNLQISGKYILGDVDSHSFEHSGRGSNEVDSYFLLDTATGKRTNFADYESLHRIASEHNIRLNLEPIDSVYSHYRFSWFDVFAGALFVLPPLGAFIGLVFWVSRIRRTMGNMVPVPSP